ncbi:unnamed protein product [Paramecium primaurelia]|uniref:Transmembrane protein n=1 Tax=Paramecium primaurelia TaxID=5886 RepID=A0A8S1MF84_PARPR|nr:unnamed protein product [Paramecium primaurelia]
MYNFFKTIDQFGIEQKLSIPSINPTQRSAIGGVATLTLYGISFAYFLYEFIDWQQNNKLPKITSLQKQINQAENVQVQDVFAEISHFAFNENKIDPFDPQNLIFYPILTTQPNNKDESKILKSRLDNTVQENGQSFNKFLIENPNFIGSPPTASQILYVDYQILFGFCDPNILEVGQQCADKETIQKYQEQQNFLQIQIYIQQYDTKQKQLIKIPKFYTLDISNEKMQYCSFNLQANQIDVDDGFLFSNSNQQIFFSDFIMFTNTYDILQSEKVYGKQSVLVAYFTIDQIKSVVYIEYPKISEILANAGSIITWILQISFIFIKYNEMICTQNARRDVISMFYTDYPDFKIRTNWLGKMTQIGLKGKNYDIMKIHSFIENLHQMADQKMSYINLQFEVSRIQLILQEYLGIDQMKKCLQQNHKLESILDKIGLYELPQTKKVINQIQPLEQQNDNLKRQDQSEGELMMFSENLPEEDLDLHIGLLLMKENTQYTQIEFNQSMLPQAGSQIDLKIRNIEKQTSSIKMNNFLLSIDQFGVEERVLFQRSLSTKRSVLGGIMTLLLYGITVTYFLYQFIDWMQNNKLPKVTSTSKQINYSETVQSAGKFLEICYFQQIHNQIDPFNPKQLIYYPTLTVNPSKEEINNIVFEQEILDSDITVNKFVLYDIELVGSPLQSQQLAQKDYQITLKRCNPDKISKDMQCADETTFNQFKEQQNLFQIQIYIQQFNIKTKELDKIPKFYVLSVSKSKQIFYNFQLESSQISIDDGILFPNSREKKFFYNMYQLASVNDIDQTNINKDQMMILYFTLDQIKLETLYEYPKISEVLADTSSIISWFFTISYFVTQYNKELSMQNIITEVVQMYCNDLQNLQIKKNWYGKIIEISFKDKSCDKVKMQKLLNKLRQLSIQKLDFRNILFEQSRLQLLLVRSMGFEQIKQLLNHPQKLEPLIDKYGIQDQKDSSNFSNLIFPQGELSNINLKLQDGLEGECNLNSDQTLEQELEKQISLFSYIDFLKIQNEDKLQVIDFKEENHQIQKFNSKLLRIENSSSLQ